MRYQVVQAPRSAVIVERVFPSGAWQCSAMVAQRDAFWPDIFCAPFFHRMTFMGYGKREAVELFVDSLTRDGLTIVDEVAA